MTGAPGRTGKGIVVICNLDTRGGDILFVKDLIRSRGHEPILLDFSMEEPPPLPGDVTCEEVADRGGLGIAAVRENYRSNRELATRNQIAGAVAIVGDLFRQGRAHGVLGIGGATSTLVATAVMRTLPFGIPKVMASPMAAHPAYVGTYVGTRDITMHHTVVDVVRMNPLLRTQITNAVGAVCGMVETAPGAEVRSAKALVAVSSFGFGEMTAQAAARMLEEAGFTPVVCHAQGRGDRAMEELIEEGVFHGVLDLCTGGVVENLFGGNRDPGPDRLMAAVRRGVPAVLAPCGLDMLSYGGREDRLVATKDRPRFVQDALRVQVRTTADELRRAADIIASRLGQAKGPFTFLVPLRGWSSLDREGQPMHDPAADASFVERLRERLARKAAIREVDLHLYTPEFARVAVDALLAMMDAARAA